MQYFVRIFLILDKLFKSYYLFDEGDRVKYAQKTLLQEDLVSHIRTLLHKGTFFHENKIAQKVKKVTDPG